ncbi:hypothetical protein C0J52_03514 [Blattella germanica]|nr:hypothetical protein C0J52_03514 [Blattella germanica]
MHEAITRTRNPVERCYGVWKRRFPVLATGIRLGMDRLQSVIVATAVLHNIAVKENENLPPVNDDQLDDINAVNNFPPQPNNQPHVAENISNASKSARRRCDEGWVPNCLYISSKNIKYCKADSYDPTSGKIFENWFKNTRAIHKVHYKLFQSLVSLDFIITKFFLVNGTLFQLTHITFNTEVYLYFEGIKNYTQESESNSVIYGVRIFAVRAKYRGFNPDQDQEMDIGMMTVN